MTYYELLDVPESASKEEIKRAYFKAVRKYTPEKNAEMFKKIRKAYEVLSDDDAREDYFRVLSIPTEFHSEYQRGLYYIEVEKYAEGIEILERIRSRKRDIEEVNVLLTRLYIYNSAPGKGVKLCESLHDEYPDSIVYEAYLGYAYIHRKYKNKAKALLKTFIEKYPECALGYAFLAESLLYDNCLREFEKIIDLGMENSSVKDTEGRNELILTAICGYTFFEENEKITAAAKALTDTGNNKDSRIYRKVRIVSMCGFLGNEYANSILKKVICLDIDEDEKDNLFDAVMVRRILEKTDISIDMISLIYRFYFVGQDENKREYDLLSAKMKCIESLTTVKPNLIYLKEHIPYVYDIARAFFDQILAAKTLYSIRIKILNKLISVASRDAELEESLEFSPSDAFYDTDFDDSYVMRGEPYVREQAKTGRNDPCPCGSGKKYKKCCGK